MIRDIATELSTAQDVKGTAATTVSTNYLDTGAAGGDIAVGTEVEVAITVTTAAAGGTSIDFQLFTDDAVGFGTEALVASTGAIAVATLVKGYTAVLKLPYGMKRYLRLKAVTVGAVSAANITAGVVKASGHWKAANPVGVSY